MTFLLELKETTRKSLTFRVCASIFLVYWTALHHTTETRGLGELNGVEVITRMRNTHTVKR